uniref:Uncharacterized protein n=1 Tax=Arundo donax TaxID=35708 RepID=A0A0A9CKG6_ARUDO
MVKSPRSSVTTGGLLS